MAKRGRKKKFKLDFNVSRETWLSILALLLILLAFISLVSFIAPDYSINSKVQYLLRGSFGYASFLSPIFFCLFGILFIEQIQIKLKSGRIVLGIFLLMLSLASLFHVFISSKNAYDLAVMGKGGGMIGYYISTLLSSTISIYGAVPLLLTVLIVSFILTFDVSLGQLLGIFHTGLPSFSFKLPAFLSFLTRKKEYTDMGDVDVVNDILDKGYSNESISPYTEVETKIEIVPTMAEPQDVKHMFTGSADSITPVSIKPLGVDKIWTPPPFDLLAEPSNESIDSGNIKERSRLIKEKLQNFGIRVEMVATNPGPSVTQYVLKAGNEVRLAKIANMHTDLAMALASPSGSVRIEAPIPGTSFVGIEVPNNKRATVSFKTLITSGPMKSIKSKLGIVIGKDVGGQVYTYDVGKMPHLLVAGATGSGKSIFIHNILFSILFRASPQEVKFILIDPKRVELTHYQGIPHLLTPVVTDMDKAPSVFKWAVVEMENRYKKFEQEKVMNIDGYNEKAGFQSMPYIIIIVDEFAEIMIQDPSGVEKSVVRLAQLARATGIHLVLALQRPTTNVITGLIKANIPSRIAFNVTSNVDSRVIIDQPGAEKLLGKGDMLFVPPDSAKPVRLQGAFVSPGEIKNVVDYLKSQGMTPDYKDEVLSMGGGSSNSKGNSSNGDFDDVDELFDESVDIVVAAGRGSASLLQTKLSIGYARAARILTQLEDKGIVGPAQGSKPRDVLVSSTGPSFKEDSKGVSSLR